MLPFASLSSIPLHELLGLGFYLILGLYAIFSFVMYYHWREYSINEQVTRITIILYFVTTLPLLGIIGLVSLMF